MRTQNRDTAHILLPILQYCLLRLYSEKRSSCFHAEKICLVFLSINIEVADRELLAIVGQVGCGKSSLISTMLGETRKLQGQVTLKVLHLEYISCAFSSDNTK